MRGPHQVFSVVPELPVARLPLLIVALRSLGRCLLSGLLWSWLGRLGPATSWSGLSVNCVAAAVGFMVGAELRLWLLWSRLSAAVSDCLRRPRRLASAATDSSGME
eukprot:2603002-Alexandrium_andersonii.AAC.1